MVKIKIFVKNVKGKCNQGMQETNNFFVDDHKIGISEGKYVCMYA
ncbi:MAG: hypothetical protein ACFFCQ_17710 [Promethearchaeota archaeon]